MNSIGPRLGKVILYAIVLVGCSGSTAPEINEVQQSEVSTATITPIATATLTPTPQPTPIGGSGRILLSVHSDVFQTTHPELSAGNQLFMLDLASSELAPLPLPPDANNYFVSFSPDYRHLAFASFTERALSLVCDGVDSLYYLYVLDTVTLEYTLVSERFVYPTCISDTGLTELVWMSNDELVFKASDPLSLRVQIHHFSISSGAVTVLTPAEKNVDYLYDAKTEDGEFFWSATVQRNRFDGFYRTNLYGDTEEIVHAAGAWILSYSPDGQFRIVRGQDENFVPFVVLIGDDPEDTTLVLEESGLNASNIIWSRDSKEFKFFNLVDAESSTSFVWNVERAELEQIPVHFGHPSAIWGPDDETIVISQSGCLYDAATRLCPPFAGPLLIYSLVSGETREIAAFGRLDSFEFSPDAQYLLAGVVWDVPVLFDISAGHMVPLALPAAWFDYYQDPNKTYFDFQWMQAWWWSSP